MNLFQSGGVISEPIVFMTDFLSQFEKVNLTMRLLIVGMVRKNVKKICDSDKEKVEDVRQIDDGVISLSQASIKYNIAKSSLSKRWKKFREQFMRRETWLKTGIYS